MSLQMKFGETVYLKFVSGYLFFSGYYPLHHLLCIVAREFIFFWYLYIYMHTCVTQLSYQIICNKTGVTSGVGTAYSTGTPELTPGF